ncbi:MAG: serine/threonine protein kinase, partial [bacterium]|nr:serine/threonine protein kinase [bacterium]
MIGKLVKHYLILEKIGEGGMGDIFLATDTTLERNIVLKFMPLESASDKRARQRFFREAKAAAALNHPNIVTIFEIDEFEEQPFIAMEYLQGSTLEEIIYADSAASLPVSSLLDIGIGLAEGLDAAHHAGVIHRDIKPQNIITPVKPGVAIPVKPGVAIPVKPGVAIPVKPGVAPHIDYSVKILDFGLAWLKGAGKLTGEISRIGTLPYMSPEQVRGDELDHRSDIWSWGVVMYEAVVRQLPFEGQYEHNIIHAITMKSPFPPSDSRPDFPKELEGIILKCLYKSREDRFSSAQQLVEALKGIREGTGGEDAPQRDSSII